MSNPAKPVIIASDQFNISTMDQLANWTAGTDTAGIALNTDHVTGNSSIEMNKTGTSGTTATMSSLALASMDLRAFALHKVRMLVKMDLTNVASVELRLGTDSSNYRKWTVADTALTTNVWNQVELDSDGSSFADTGDGIKWGAVFYRAIVVNFDAAGNTLNDILVDLIDVYKKSPSGGTGGSDVNVAQVGGENVATDDSTMTATPKFLPVGGEYRSGLTTYTDGDATVLQTDVNGKLLVAQSADIEIGAVEIKDGTTDARQAVKVDNAGATATPTVAIVGAHYKAALDTYDDNDAVPLHTNANGAILTQPHDGTTAAGVIAATTALKTDTSSVAGTATDVNAGNVSAGSQRIAIATDDVNSAAINSATSRLTSSANAYTSGATLATTSFGVGGQYNATPPTMTDTHSGSIQLDVSGQTKVVDSAAGTLLGTIDTDTGVIAGDTTSIDGKTPSLGRAAPAASVPVVTSIGTPESGTDATGADAYATVLTPSTTFEHISIVNEGTNPATVSLDAGVTDHFIRIAGGSSQSFDGVAVAAAAIQAKNASAGNNYTNLTVTVW